MPQVQGCVRSVFQLATTGSHRFARPEPSTDGARLWSRPGGILWLPTRFRAADFGISYALATAPLSGVAPLVATALIGVTGNVAAPGWYLTAAGLVSLPIAM